MPLQLATFIGPNECVNIWQMLVLIGPIIPDLSSNQVEITQSLGHRKGFSGETGQDLANKREEILATSGKLDKGLYTPVDILPSSFLSFVIPQSHLEFTRHDTRIDSFFSSLDLTIDVTIEYELAETYQKVNLNP